jgi:hypothetical protein
VTAYRRNAHFSERFRELEARIATLEDGLDGAVEEALPAEIARELRRARGVWESTRRAPEEASRAPAGEALVAALESAHAVASRVRERNAVTPDVLRTDGLQGAGAPVPKGTSSRTMGGQLRRALIAFDPDVRAAHADRASALLRSRSFDPIGARATRTGSGNVPAVRCEVVTSVARALPPLELTPEPPFAGLRRLFVADETSSSVTTPSMASSRSRGQRRRRGSYFPLSCGSNWCGSLGAPCRRCPSPRASSPSHGAMPSRGSPSSRRSASALRRIAVP